MQRVCACSTDVTTDKGCSVIRLIIVTECRELEKRLEAGWLVTTHLWKLVGLMHLVGSYANLSFSLPKSNPVLTLKQPTCPHKDYKSGLTNAE